jgi:UDP-glucose 4-epimerase
LPVVVVRLFNTVGPRQSSQYGMVIPRFVEAALLKQPLAVYGDGKQSRCFCHVDDVVRALDLVMKSKECIGKVINVGSDEEVSIADLAKRIVRLTESGSKIQFIPYEQAFPDGGFEDMQRRIPSLERVRQLTGWAPQKVLDEIIRDIVADRRDHLGLKS